MYVRVNDKRKNVSVFGRKGKSVCVCVHVCWHVLDAIVEMSVISIYLFVRWHIKALNRISQSLPHFVVTSSFFSHLYLALKWLLPRLFHFQC